VILWVKRAEAAYGAESPISLDARAALARTVTELTDPKLVERIREAFPDRK
jgi:hypothetical protein